METFVNTRDNEEDASEKETNMEETSKDEEEESTKTKEFDPKLYKTTLCSFYLQGPCKNGDGCNFAHGTSELRLYGGKVIETGESGGSDKKTLKTTLCVKFVTNGVCCYGPNCTFAHSVKEVKAALEALNARERAEKGSSANNKDVSSHPNFKTTLCQNYMTGLYCPFADKCQYAHGKHELRAKVPFDQAPNEVKKHKLEKAKRTPGYKTKMCETFEKSGSCGYEEYCVFAHGESDLLPFDNSGAPSVDKSDQNKRENNTPWQKKPCRNMQMTGTCPLGSKCKFDHNLGGASKIVGTKTYFCRELAMKSCCPRGRSCPFAHSEEELHPSVMGNQMLSPPMHGGSMNQLPMHSIPSAPSASMSSYSTYQNPYSNNMSYNPMSSMERINDYGSSSKISSKLPIVCKNIRETGYCPRMSSCEYVHTEDELLELQAADPKYKSTLCETWQKTGVCQYNSACRFAHGTLELRQVPTLRAPSPQYPPPQYPPNYKTVLCSHFEKNGNCTNGRDCQFAHGSQELRAASFGNAGNPPANYKTVLCKQFSEDGECPRGPNCSFAHGNDDLRSSGGVKRKPDPQHQPFKTTLCNNFMMFNKCPYGSSCNFAHGEAELSSSKKPKIF